MSHRQNNQLPLNLCQLQNLIKRDPDSYREEFCQQYRHFEATLAVFELKPNEFSAPLEQLIIFLAQVSKCYPEELSTYPQILFEVLRKHSTILDANMRISFCRALILLRHKQLLAPSELLQLFFDLLKCPDKSLRKFLKSHIINDLRNLNSKVKDVRLNSTLQNFMFSILRIGTSNKIAFKTALDIMVELYRRGIWRNEKTVNVISSVCFNDITKLMVTAVKFFLDSDQLKGEEGSDDDSASDDDDLPTIKEVTMANKFNSKTRKRERLMLNLRKAHKRRKKRDSLSNSNCSTGFSALHLIHDPQELAEKLFSRIQTRLKSEKFEVRLLFLELVSRLIGVHQLILLNYYPYVARFLRPHQREVVRLLQFSAQACHNLVPPDAVMPVLKAIVDNFVTERNSAEVISVGLNAIRELCLRCPLVMDETLLRDLTGYKTYKDKGVMMAARGLIHVFANSQPELLHKKDRGRMTEARAESQGVSRFGEIRSLDYLPGAEVLRTTEDVEQKANVNDEITQSKQINENATTFEEKAIKASNIVCSRILSDADFRRIESAQLKKNLKPWKRGKKRPLATEEEVNENDDDESDNGQYCNEKVRNELVDLSSIEMVFKKRRHDKQSRLETVEEGRKNRPKFGRKTAKSSAKTSSTNKEKMKRKNFMMTKHKLKSKAKKSFVQKQNELKKSMLKSKRFK